MTHNVIMLKKRVDIEVLEMKGPTPPMGNLIITTRKKLLQIHRSSSPYSILKKNSTGATLDYDHFSKT